MLLHSCIHDARQRAFLPLSGVNTHAYGTKRDPGEAQFPVPVPGGKPRPVSMLSAIYRQMRSFLKEKFG